MARTEGKERMIVPDKIIIELIELMNRAEDLRVDTSKTMFQLGKLHTLWEQWKDRPRYLYDVEDESEE